VSARSADCRSRRTTAPRLTPTIWSTSRAASRCARSNVSIGAVSGRQTDRIHIDVAPSVPPRGGSEAREPDLGTGVDVEEAAARVANSLGEQCGKRSREKRRPARLAVAAREGYERRAAPALVAEVPAQAVPDVLDAVGRGRTRFVVSERRRTLG